MHIKRIDDIEKRVLNMETSRYDLGSSNIIMMDNMVMAYESEQKHVRLYE